MAAGERLAVSTIHYGGYDASGVRTRHALAVRDGVRVVGMAMIERSDNGSLLLGTGHFPLPLDCDAIPP